MKDLVYRYMGEAEATQRKALTVNQVTRDRDGLKRLLVSIIRSNQFRKVQLFAFEKDLVRIESSGP